MPASTAARWRESFSLRRNVAALFHRPADHLAVVDGFRALSILAVVFIHGMLELGYLVPADFYARFSTTPVGHLFLQGELGVDVFFVVSGLLVTQLLLRDHRALGKIRLSTFYYRRALRLLPAYYLVLAIYCLTQQPNWRNVWANLLYVNNYVPAAGECMPWAWSLAIEEQFYLVFPLLLLGFLRLKSPFQRTVAVLALAAIALGARLYALDRSGLAFPFAAPSAGPEAELALANVSDAMYFPTHLRFGALLCGAVVANALHTGVAQRVIQSSRWLGHALQIVGALCVTIVMYTSRIVVPGTDYMAKSLLASRAYNAAYFVAYHYVFAAGVALLLLVMLCGRGFSLPARILAHKAFHPIAQLSYSAYLVNHLLLSGLEELVTPRITTSLVAIFCIVASGLLTFGVAAIVYVLVEKPFIELRRGGRMASSRAPGIDSAPIPCTIRKDL